MATCGHLGGLTWAAPQAIRVLDAAGCDVVLVETVGVGQSEVEIASQADTSVVLLAPGMGDGIQAAKAGSWRSATCSVVNKAGPGRRGRHRPASSTTCWGSASPAALGRLAAADREDRRGARRGHRRGRRGAGEAPRVDGGARRARGAPGGAGAREVETIAVTALRERIGDLRRPPARRAGRADRGR